MICASGVHPVPSRTRSLSLTAPMVLGGTTARESRSSPTHSFNSIQSAQALWSYPPPHASWGRVRLPTRPRLLSCLAVVSFARWTNPPSSSTRSAATSTPSTARARISNARSTTWPTASWARATRRRRHAGSLHLRLQAPRPLSRRVVQSLAAAHRHQRLLRRAAPPQAPPGRLAGGADRGGAGTGRRDRGRRWSRTTNRPRPRPAPRAGPQKSRTASTACPKTCAGRRHVGHAWAWTTPRSPPSTGARAGHGQVAPVARPRPHARLPAPKRHWELLPAAFRLEEETTP